MADTLKDRASALPETPGVYLFKDGEGRVLYIGKAKSLRDRVTSYFSRPDRDKIRVMMKFAVDLEVISTPSEVDALLLESRLIKDFQPKYNQDLRDGKTYPYLAISKGDDFPYLSVVRGTEREDLEYLGPFASASGLRAALAVLQRVFKFRTCEMEIREDDPKLRHFRPCLLHHIDRCTAPCNLRVSKAEYAASIAALRRVLAGESSALRAEWEQAMTRASAALEYETAAALRDRIRALDSLKRMSRVGDYTDAPKLTTDPREAVEALGEELCEGEPPRIIEGLDIAHLQGSESVGSLVSFMDGLPYKAGYRRYRLEEVRGVDDYAALREVVRRRLKRVQRGEEMLPDLLLVDGGKGQLAAVLEVFGETAVSPPWILSLAKRAEEIYLPGRGRPVRLPRQSPALKLLQAVRDEAHRFARHYHHLLRSKKHFGGGIRPKKKITKTRKHENKNEER